jgi:hypothetical protein
MSLLGSKLLASTQSRLEEMLYALMQGPSLMSFSLSQTVPTFGAPQERNQGARAKSQDG